MGARGQMCTPAPFPVRLAERASGTGSAPAFGSFTHSPGLEMAVRPTDLMGAVAFARVLEEASERGESPQAMAEFGGRRGKAAPQDNDDLPRKWTTTNSANNPNNRHKWSRRRKDDDQGHGQHRPRVEMNKTRFIADKPLWGKAALEVVAFNPAKTAYILDKLLSDPGRADMPDWAVFNLAGKLLLDLGQAGYKLVK
uniref:Calponin-homology (CH) domain-containing protein n=1 Tax=Globodera pallida TaxID=36090 RepID=A0A183C097_GLOPA